ncbi:ISL3 family transposase [Paenarthrobacter sp. PH39-S1]|uniref:ISL3 family transposase n=1 Tax=Paenarthrobacter sp. PH39-S1 TaxID=3046204 RepID=UPI0024B9433B|nr:ISL3 family transposase [Paenarthrobacter sp. PH39-S1]MDJ0358484.1 ISL3 family transposase [Paenarthrobacter sp. PH39-S1]
MDTGAQDGLFNESAVERVQLADDGRVDANGGVKKRFRAFAPDAVMLVPPSLEEWLPGNHLARFIAELVDTELDLARFYKSYAKAKGQPPYDPRLMLRIVLYGYCVGVRSSREIERACTDVVAFRWLAAQQAPDFRSISLFREGKRVLIDDRHRFDAVKVIGVDEHVWRHTRRGDKYVTVIIDLTPIRDGTGPSRLLDMVEGRSKQVFATWLKARPQPWRDGIEVVAMDGFSGFKSAVAEELPDAVPVMDPFHVVRLAGEALDSCRRRVQQQTCGHRGRAGDPLYSARLTLHTGADLLTDKQRQRLETLFSTDTHVEVEASWGIYQRMVAAYREPDRPKGRELMQAVIDSVSTGVPSALTELRTLGRTLNRRAADVLAYFERPGTSNGPTEAINGRLEHLRGSALGFRNLTNYVARSLLESGGFRPKLHPQF